MRFGDLEAARCDALLRAAPSLTREWSLEKLDGFISALVLSPKPLSITQAWSEWTGIEWSETDDESNLDASGLLEPFDAQSHDGGSRELLDLLCLRQKDLTVWWFAAVDDAPDSEGDIGPHPIILVPEAVASRDWSELPDHIVVGEDWAAGFFRAVHLQMTEWDLWLKADPWLVDSFDWLSELLVPFNPIHGDEESAQGPTFVERMEIIQVLPEWLQELAEYAQDQRQAQVLH